MWMPAYTRNAPKIYITHENLLDQRRARKNHHAAHHQRAQNPPFQHAVLKTFVDRERAKDHQEKEQIIDTEGFLDQIAGKKLNSTLLPGKCQTPSPNSTDSAIHAMVDHKRLAQFDLMQLAVEDAEVERHRNQHE